MVILKAKFSSILDKFPISHPLSPYPNTQIPTTWPSTCGSYTFSDCSATTRGILTNIFSCLTRTSVRLKRFVQGYPLLFNSKTQPIPSFYFYDIHTSVLSFPCSLHKINKSSTYLHVFSNWRFQLQLEDSVQWNSQRKL